jgi:hypothetical protein
MSTYYLRKPDGSVYGPVELSSLCHWAAEGRVAPDDAVSEDKASWTPAPELSALKMHWVVHQKGGESVGPIHIMALCDLVKEGVVRWQDQVTDRDSEQMMTVQEGVLAALDECRSALVGAEPPDHSACEEKLKAQREAFEQREQDLRAKVEKLQESVEQLTSQAEVEPPKEPISVPADTERIRELEQALQAAENKAGGLESQVETEQANSAKLQAELDEARSQIGHLEDAVEIEASKRVKHSQSAPKTAPEAPRADKRLVERAAAEIRTRTPDRSQVKRRQQKLRSRRRRKH